MSSFDLRGVTETVLELKAYEVCEVCLESNATGCAVRATDERGMSGLCCHLTSYLGNI